MEAKKGGIGESLREEVGAEETAGWTRARS